MFTQKGRSIENIPPTKAALTEQIKRATFQGGHVWGQALTPNPQLPSPTDWGWKHDVKKSLVPHWTLLSEASKSCSELLKCGCKQLCNNRCKCKAAGLQCTALCYCGGLCSGI